MSEWVNTRQPAPKPDEDDDYADDWFNDTDDETKSNKASPAKAAKPAESKPQVKQPTPPPSPPPPLKGATAKEEVSAAAPAKTTAPRKSVLPEPASWSPREEPEPVKQAGSSPPPPPEKEASVSSSPAASASATDEAKPVRVGVPLSLQSPPPRQGESPPPPEQKAAADEGSESGKAAWLTDSDGDVPDEEVPAVVAVPAPRQPSPSPEKHAEMESPPPNSSLVAEVTAAPSTGKPSVTKPPPAKKDSKQTTPRATPSQGPSRVASRSPSRPPKDTTDDTEPAAAAEEPPKSWLSRISAPRAIGKKHADIDAERKAESEAEARRREKYVADLKKHGVSERIESLGAPRPVKVDPRAGRPPPEIEERQRVANLKFKEASKRRAQEFDKVLETEQRRLFTRFNEYAVANGMAPLADPGSGEDADVEAIAMVLATSHLTGVPSAPQAAAITSPPRSDRHDWDDGATTDGAPTSRAAASPDRHAAAHSTSPSSSPKKHDDGSVRIAGHVSEHPTSTERSTFRPSTWKQSLDAADDDEALSHETSPERSMARQRQPLAGPQNGRRARSEVTRIGSDGHLLPMKAKAATPTPSTVAKPVGGRRSNASSTPVPGSTSSIAESKRTKCAGAGGLSVIDGAVADFLLGDGNVRRSKVPAMYKKRTASSLPPVQRK